MAFKERSNRSRCACDEVREPVIATESYEVETAALLIANEALRHANILQSQVSKARPGHPVFLLATPWSPATKQRRDLGHPAERLATARVDARSLARFLDLPGPQKRGTGGTHDCIRAFLRSGPPVPAPRHPRSPKARDRGHPRLHKNPFEIGGHLPIGIHDAVVHRMRVPWHP